MKINKLNESLIPSQAILDDCLDDYLNNAFGYNGVEDYVATYTNPKKEVDYFDGLSFAKTLTGKEGQQAHDFLYWEFEETDQVAVRMGDWKMVSKAGKPHLYDLSKDVHEDNDIAEQHPDIVKKMVEIAHSQHTESPYFKVTMPIME